MLSLLARDLSFSPLGITTGLQFLPIVLLTPLAGALSDAFPKRRVMLVSQSLMAFFALLMGVWVLHGGLDEGRFELLRPARHSSCTLPFAVWMALCKATPLRTDEESGQQSHLGAPEAAAALAALEIPAEGSDAAPSDIPPVPEATSPLDSGPAGTPPPCPGTT